MLIRERLFFFFIIVGLVPLLFASTIVISSQERAITRHIVQRLEAIASIQEERLNQIIDRYLEQTKLITSRTQLRRNVEGYVQTGDEDLLIASQRILIDAIRSVPDISEINLYSTAGEFLISTNSNKEGNPREFLENDLLIPRLEDLFKNDQNIVRVHMLGPLRINGETVGVLEVVISAAPIFAVTEDYTGLGETGEVLIVKRNKSGDALFLTPLRYDAGAALTRGVLSSQVNVPVTEAIRGIERIILDDNTRDYRGESVVAATRFIESTEWGIVVKIDQEEVFQSVTRLRKTVTIIAIETILVVVGISLLVSQVIARPLKDLTKFVGSIKKEGFKNKFFFKREDEIGILARAFNKMTDELGALYKDLENKVKQRTKELEKAKGELEDKVTDLERFNRLTVDREMKMVDLKKELKELKEKGKKSDS
ncbi:hypothetical protein CL654_00070 [bacterium]|nr:hypothetical protein [bacterium]|tara:strand:+ start:9733 stop:11010 length:1278 start_codon:yes stop_codon:yes gene_type:complete